MNLTALTRTVRRHKLATIPALLLAVVGIAYVGFVKAPTFQAQSTYVLVPGASPPTQGQLAKDPALNRLNSNNPFEQYGDISVVGDLLINFVSSPGEAAVLAGEGVPGGYTVVPYTSSYGASPIVEITTDGPTATVASRAAIVVGEAMQNKLVAMQGAQGTSRQYWISFLEIARPSHPQAQLSSKLRDLVAVIAADAVLLFVIVSILNAREEGKRESLHADPTGEGNGWAGHGVEPQLRNFVVPPGNGVAPSGDQIDSGLQRGQPEQRAIDPQLLKRLTRQRSTAFPARPSHGGSSDEATARAQHRSASGHAD